MQTTAQRTENVFIQIQNVIVLEQASVMRSQLGPEKTLFKMNSFYVGDLCPLEIK